MYLKREKVIPEQISIVKIVHRALYSSMHVTTWVFKSVKYFFTTCVLHVVGQNI
jgi:hypothetical protein